MTKNFMKIAVWSLATIMSVGVLSCDSKTESDTKTTNALVNCIMTRKSVRQFENTTIPNETIETLLRAGMSAPSAMNKQPWKFVVVQNKEILKCISDSMPNSRTATAPMAIIVCGDMSKTLDDVAREFWVQDCSAASQNILLAAHSMGLGAVWTGVYPDLHRAKILADIIKLENKYIPLNIIPIGYPAENPDIKDKWNPDNVIYK